MKKSTALGLALLVLLMALAGCTGSGATAGPQAGSDSHTANIDGGVPDEPESPGAPCDGTTPQHGDTSAPNGGITPPGGGITPPGGGTTPQYGNASPPNGGTTPPNDGSTPPNGGTTLPNDGTALPAETRWAAVPAVFVNDTYYRFFDVPRHRLPALDDSWVFLGTIEGTVPGWESPTQNYQSNNDGLIGAEIFHSSRPHSYFI